MPIPTRPSGKSILSDIASAGAGFAVGLKKEQEKKRAEALENAMRQFDMDIKRQQLGLETRQVGLQEAAGRLQQEEAIKAEAARQVNQRMAKEQLELTKQEYEQNKIWRQQQRQLEYDKLEAEEKRLRLELANRWRLGQLEVAGRLNQDHAGKLNEMDDNLRQDIRDFKSDIANADLITAAINRPGTEAEWIAARDKALSSGDKKTATEFQNKLDKLAAWDELRKRKTQVNDAMYDNLVKAGAISKQLGVPAADIPTTEKRWRDYTPEEKQERLAQLGQALLTKPDLDLEPFFDLGVSRQEIEAARRMASPAPVTGKPPTPTESLVTPYVPPTAVPVKPPTPEETVQQKIGELVNPMTAPSQRAPILSGGGSPDSLLAKRKFMLDKSPGKHRIQP